MREIATVVLLLATLPLVGCTVVMSPRAYLEHRACLKVRPGMSEQDVLDRMGMPRERLDRSAVERVLYYRWLFNSSGPMYVVLDKGATNYSVRFTECESSG